MSKHHNDKKNPNKDVSIESEVETSKETNNASEAKENKELLELKNINQQLLLEIDTNKELINKLNVEITNLKSEIGKINQDYIEKVTLKAKEAKDLVDKKYLELEEKSKLETIRQVDRIIESKFDVLLSAIEQLTAIVNSPVNSPELTNYLYGFKMILGMLQNGLAEIGIIQIVVNVGDAFDENLMQAFEMVDNKMVEPGKVASVISNAYKYKDMIIKHAVVRVQR